MCGEKKFRRKRNARGKTTKVGIKQTSIKSNKSIFALPTYLAQIRMCECDSCHFLNAAIKTTTANTTKKSRRITTKREECKCQVNFYKQNNTRTTITNIFNKQNIRGNLRKPRIYKLKEYAYRGSSNFNKQQYATTATKPSSSSSSTASTLCESTTFYGSRSSPARTTTTLSTVLPHINNPSSKYNYILERRRSLHSTPFNSDSRMSATVL